MFLSLLAVFGKLDPLHITNGVPPFSPAAFRKKGANGISHDAPSTSAPDLSLVDEAGDDPAGFCRKAGLWTKLDWPASAIAFESCSFVFGHPSVPCPRGWPNGVAADGLDPLFAAPAGDDDADDNEGVRVACDTGEIALGGDARSAWKSAALLFVPRKVPPKSWSSASPFPPPPPPPPPLPLPPLCESAEGVQWSNDSKEEGRYCWPLFIIIGGLSAGDGSAKDVNMGLLAMVLYSFENEKGASMLTSCGSSAGFSIFGSNEMRELKLRLYCDGGDCVCIGDLLGPAPGDEKLNCMG